MDRESIIKHTTETIEQGFTMPDLNLMVEIIAGHCCQPCDDRHGQKFTLEEARDNPPLPFDGCEREWGCNCCITLILVE